MAGRKCHRPGKCPYRAACGSALRLATRPRLLDRYTTRNAFWLVGLVIGHSATVPRSGSGGVILETLTGLASYLGRVGHQTVHAA